MDTRTTVGPITAVVAVISLALAGTSNQGDVEEKALSSDMTVVQADNRVGARLYSSQCRACHGNRGRGDGVAGRVMDPPPTDISDSLYLASVTDEDLVRVIMEGSGTMGPLKDLTDDEIQSLVVYVRWLGERR